MKEIIAKRNKRNSIILLVLSLVSIVSSVIYRNMPLLCYIWIPMSVLFSLVAVASVYYIIDPKGVIVLEGDKISIREGLRVAVVPLECIIEVARKIKPDGKEELLGPNITIKARVGDTEREFLLDVEDSEAVVKRLNELMKSE